MTPVGLSVFWAMACFVKAENHWCGDYTSDSQPFQGTGPEVGRWLTAVWCWQEADEASHKLTQLTMSMKICWSQSVSVYSKLATTVKTVCPQTHALGSPLFPVRANWMAFPPTPQKASMTSWHPQKLCSTRRAMCSAILSGVTENQPSAHRQQRRHQGWRDEGLIMNLWTRVVQVIIGKNSVKDLPGGEREGAHVDIIVGTRHLMKEKLTELTWILKK